MNTGKTSSVKSTTRVAIFLLGMSALLNLYSTQPILEQIGKWANITSMHAAWTISASTAGVALTAPIAGIISDKLGRKNVILSALALMATLTIFCIFAPNFTGLLVLRFMQGMCCPFVFAVIVAYIGEEYKKELAVSLNSLYIAGTAFGGFSGRIVAALISDFTGSWKLSFTGNAFILGGTLLVCLKWLPKEQNFSTDHSSSDSNGFFTGLGLHIRNWKILVTVLVAATLLFQQVASFTFASLRLSLPPYSLSASVIGLLFVVFLLPTVTTPLFGRLFQRFGPILTFGTSQAISVLGLLLTLIPTLPTMFIGLAFSCIGVFAGQSVGTSMINVLAEKYRSTAVGIYLAGYYFGGALGAILPGRVYDEHSWNGVATMLLFIIFAVTPLACFAWRTNNKV